MCDGNNLILSSSWQYLRKYLSWQYLGKYLSGKYLYFQYIGSSSLPSSPSLGLHVWSSLPGKVCRGLWHWSDSGADYNHPVLLTTIVQTDAKYFFSGKIGHGTCPLLKLATAEAGKIYQSWVLIDVIQKHQILIDVFQKHQHFNWCYPKASKS